MVYFSADDIRVICHYGTSEKQETYANLSKALVEVREKGAKQNANLGGSVAGIFHSCILKRICSRRKRQGGVFGLLLWIGKLIRKLRVRF